MVEYFLLGNAADLTTDQQKRLLNLHYSFLNFQRGILETTLTVPEFDVSVLFRGNTVGVAMDNGLPIGYCIYRVIGGVLKLRTLYVQESHRMHGVMNAILNKIRDHEVFWQAQLVVHKGCVGAKNLFIKRGYDATPDGDWVNLAFYSTDAVDGKQITTAIPA